MILSDLEWASRGLSATAELLVVQIGTSDPQDEGMKQSTVDQEVKVQGHARQCSLASA